MAKDYNETLYAMLLARDPEGSIKFAGRVALTTGALSAAAGIGLYYVITLVTTQFTSLNTVTAILGIAAIVVLSLIFLLTSGVCASFIRDRFALISRRRS